MAHPLVEMLGELRDKMECTNDRQHIQSVIVAIEEEDEDFMLLPITWPSFWAWWTSDEMDNIRKAIDDAIRGFVVISKIK